MSISHQITKFLILLAVLFLGITWLVQVVIVRPTFEQLEREQAGRNVGRVEDAIAADIRNVSNLANDWGAWDDTLTFVRGENPGYVKTNLMDSTFTNTNTDFVCVLDAKQQVVWGKCFDAESEQYLEIPDLFAFVTDPQSGLGSFPNRDRGVEGILMTSQAPMLLAARPVMRTDRTGPIQGTMIFGRFLNAARVRDLSQRTHLVADIWDRDASNVPTAVREALAEITSSDAVNHIDINDSILWGITTLPGLRDNTACLVRVEQPRSIHQLGRRASLTMAACSLLGGLILMLGTYYALQIRIVKPLQRMTRHIGGLRLDHDLQLRLPEDRSDEIGVLAERFNDLLEKIQGHQNAMSGMLNAQQKAPVGLESRMQQFSVDGSEVVSDAQRTM
ncbi:MAG: HAMP domain-containing protein, partial [Planctomycetaceae bacterium]|nr:HAMP domain-containing protein [Planctomycetaceae bacterium]